MISLTYTYILIIVLLIFLPLKGFAKKRIKSRMLSSFYSICLEYSILFILLYLSLTEFDFNFIQFFHIQFADAFEIIIEVSLSVILILGLDLFSLSLLLKKNIYNLEQKETTFSRNTAFSDNHLLNKVYIIIFCILSGTWEEVIFRGILFYLFDFFGISIFFTILFSSIIFSLFHFTNGVNQMLYSFFYGLIFALIYAFTDSLIAVVIAHITGNMFVLLVSIPIWKKKRRRNIFF